MRNALLAALAALPFASLPAFAGEGNGAPFAYAGSGSNAASLAAADAGSEARPASRGSVVSTGGAKLAVAGGSEGLIQTANSLPAAGRRRA